MSGVGFFVVVLSLSILFATGLGKETLLTRQIPFELWLVMCL